MTVSYTNVVSNSRIGTFFKLLFLWKGLLFIVVYAILSMIYRFSLAAGQKEYTQIIPLTFVLGFYVSIVFGRWWQQFQTIAWPDRLALYISSYVKGNDERGRIMRRTMVRYLNLSSVLGLRLNSSSVMKRFPTMQHLIEGGFLTAADLEHLEDVAFPMAKFWVPCHWVASLMRQARDENRIDSDFVLVEMIKEIGNFVFSVRMLTYFDWISVPLIYTQVVTLAVYSWAVAALVGRQYLDPSKDITGRSADFVFPVFTMLEFFFYMGWLKVAESTINPFGEDDDDFETNFIIDRNLKISYAYVDNNHGKVPPLEPDLFFGQCDFTIPHTLASWHHKTKGIQSSTKEIRIPKKLTEIVVQAAVTEEDEEEGNGEDDLRSVTDSILHTPRAFHRRSLRKRNSSVGVNSFGTTRSIDTPEPDAESIVGFRQSHGAPPHVAWLRKHSLARNQLQNQPLISRPVGVRLGGQERSSSSSELRPLSIVMVSARSKEIDEHQLKNDQKQTPKEKLFTTSSKSGDRVDSDLQNNAKQ